MAGLSQIKKKTANRFNEFFSRQCTPLDNDSECKSQLILYTDKRLSSVVFDDQDMIKFIRALNINKVHAISMIKICDSI